MPVEFPEEKFDTDDNITVAKTPTMVKWVMKTGLVKNEKQANIVLIIIAVIFLALSFYVFAGMGSKSSSGGKVIYLEDIPEDELQNIPPEVLETIPSRYDQQ